jgi:hypothetical protein
MLDPAGLGEILGEFLLGHRNHLASLIEQNAAVGGGACVQSHDVLCHSEFLLWMKIFSKALHGIVKIPKAEVLPRK